jgi:hypothetical protein
MDYYNVGDDLKYNIYGKRRSCMAVMEWEMDCKQVKQNEIIGFC